MKKSAFILIILAGILWGTSGLFVHYLSPLGFSSMQMVCIRGTVAAIFMMIYALLFNRGIFKMNRTEVILAVASGISMFVTGAAYYAAIRASSVSTAAVLMYTAPAMVMAFSVAVMGERMTKLKLVSVVLMLIGCALVSGIIGGMKFGVLGVSLGLLSGVSYSAYNIFTKFQMRRQYNPITCTMYCFVVMAIASMLLANPVDIAAKASQNLPVALPLMIGIGLCTSVLPYFFYTLSLRDLPAGTASALGIIEPMSATIFSVAILGERLTVFSLIGIVLIIGSVFLLSKSE